MALSHAEDEDFIIPVETKAFGGVSLLDRLIIGGMILLTVMVFILFVQMRLGIR